MKVAVLAGGPLPRARGLAPVGASGGDRRSDRSGHEAELIDPGEAPLAETLAERAPDVCYLTLHGKGG
jgi:hypothetical protein